MMLAESTNGYRPCPCQLKNVLIDVDLAGKPQEEQIGAITFTALSSSRRMVCKQSLGEHRETSWVRSCKISIQSKEQETSTSKKIHRIRVVVPIKCSALEAFLAP